jgi:hypothetical protein
MHCWIAHSENRSNCDDGRRAPDPPHDGLPIDGDRPLRSVLLLLGQHRRRVLAAVAFFSVKKVPVWLTPVDHGQGDRRRRVRRIRA